MLIPLLFEDTKRLCQRDIVLYEKNNSYLIDFKRKYPLLFDRTKYIVEKNPRYWGWALDKAVVGTKTLENVDWKKTDLIITSDYYEEAFEHLLELNIKLPDNVYYFLNGETEDELEYREKLRDVSTEKVVLFRSGPHASQYVKGTDYADNARAVFEYMISAGYNREWKLIWMVKNPEEYRYISDRYDNVEFISFDWNTSSEADKREKYFNTLFLAKYILFTDAYGFARNCRKGQIRIQLWHGCGFKTRTNFVPCEKRYEYNIVISELYKRIHADIYGLRDEQVVITGYPKADWLFHPAEENNLEKIGIKKADKYIFWLPTFRTAKGQLTELNEKSFDGVTGLPILERAIDIERLDDVLKKNDAVMVVKLHPFQDESKICINNCSNIITLKNENLTDNDLQINHILGYASALISDYSSVAVEYMLLDRPIAFTLDDIEEYKASRGFVFDKIEDYLPGEKIYNAEDFFRVVNDVLEGRDTSVEIRHKLMNEMYKYKDDQSSKRVTEWMMKL